MTLAVLLPMVFLILWTAAMYNRLIRLRNHCHESWSGIDTELKRRYELIPNLVETVKGYAAHERAVLQQVTDARARAVSSTGSPQEQAQDESSLIRALKGFFAVAEGYPDLKADRNFLDLQRELANTEDRIAAARRYFNANVRDYNTRTEVFPSNLVANLFGFKRQEFFEIEDSTLRQAPQVKLGPGSSA
jgi:LemA protein